MATRACSRKLASQNVAQRSLAYSAACTKKRYCSSPPHVPHRSIPSSPFHHHPASRIIPSRASPLGSRDAWRHALQINVNTWMVLELYPPLSLLLPFSSCPPRSLALRSLAPHVFLVPLVIAPPIHFVSAAEPLRKTANWHGRNLGNAHPLHTSVKLYN
eukprot:6718574-Pyramimonas_sp.AAC.1